MLGNGVSASPSTLAATAEAAPGSAAWDPHGPPPRFSVADNVRAQRSLLHSLGVIQTGAGRVSPGASGDSHAPAGAAQPRKTGQAPLALVYGYSMGALQAFEWAVAHPDEVARVAAVCGASRCGELNSVFLRSLEATLQARAHAQPSGHTTTATMHFALPDILFFQAFCSSRHLVLPGI
jgi:pimeloyl-ACP methyl ester carboxylesterase